MPILIATTNSGKVKEFKEMLEGQSGEQLRGMQVIGLKDLGREIPVPEETGSSFADNSALKASYYARATGMATLADDSGLEVMALNGEPGINSSDYAAMHGRPLRVDTTSRDGTTRDADNNALLLEKLLGVPGDNRRGRFVCVLTLADKDGRVLRVARGEMPGRILHEAAGKGGFGYDPLFCAEGFDVSTAELSPEQKNAISHRGKAMRKMLELMGQTGLMGQSIFSD